MRRQSDSFSAEPTDSEEADQGGNVDSDSEDKGDV